ncbi:sensor histidine kinase [Romboutsia lituseburensis]|uniref:histidine kinase n=1 Tax=Romboutsia lituseburensis DSM 797 TaxID=1121325 RepID=A0A1G9N8B9_9FIRM|nr:ATP-binding protein [Romboutsia lituseburensis]CEH34154.1 PAS domain S-box protein [Romboutsia lituseburensis]SDL82633.1 PAS domain S-box-containing protein [Romboutsia lituseburensis DSM 797]
MEQNIYRAMIEDSPMAYMHAKLVRETSGSYIGLIVRDVNKSFEIFFEVRKKDIINKLIVNDLSLQEKKEWGMCFEKAINEKKNTVVKYIGNIDLYLNIEIYNTDDDEFHIRFNKLSKQSFKLSSILRKSPFYAWIKDREGVYLDVNDKYMELINLSYEEIIGKKDYELFEKHIADEFERQDNKILKENSLYTCENIKIFNGKKRYFETAKWPYTDEENESILGVMGIAIEITDKVALKESIEKNEMTFLEIANNLDDIIVIMDQKKIIYVSPSFEKIYGINPEEMGVYEDINNWYEYWDEVIFEKTPNKYNSKEISIDKLKVIKDGKEIWLWSKFVPLFDENGNIIKKIGIVSDITKSKKMAEELESLRMDFFANLSHELRTPINLILSSLQVIGLRMDKLDEEHFNYFHKYLDIIHQNGLRMLKLVNNLIDTTKLESGHFSYNPKNGDIISCIENICMSVCEFVDDNKMNIVFDTNVEEKMIAFDQDNLERIMLNLISNAIKFNKPDGIIEVIINCNENVQIIVKDSGIGIPSDKLESIFGRFEQVKNKFEKERAGSGIGLSLVKSLVEKHNGTIHAKSEIGKGSEFIINLPDVLIENGEEDICPHINYLNNIASMEVEFSDIYT